MKQFPDIERLLRVLSQGEPADVVPGECLKGEVAYGNHPSMFVHTAVITEKFISDVILGRA